MLSRLLLPAGLAGLVAALLLSLMQLFWVTPLILEAERYEDQAAALAEALPHKHKSEDDQAWQPTDGWPRTLTTAGSNLILAVGFGLMLTGAYQLRRPSHWRQGLIWGLAGYTAFFAAPSLGLPPELPGTTAAELFSRQIWWLMTVCATALGLSLLLLQYAKLLKWLGLAILLAPHLLGAPQALNVGSLAPQVLQSQFIVATAFCNLLFWLALGALSAALSRHYSQTGMVERG